MLKIIKIENLKSIYKQISMDQQKIETNHLTDSTYYGIPLSQLENIDFRKKDGIQLKYLSGKSVPVLKNEIKSLLNKQNEIKNDNQCENISIEKRHVKRIYTQKYKLVRKNAKEKIQNFMLRWWFKKRIEIYGPCRWCVDLSNNKEDFVTLEEISSIPLKYFISFKENTNFYYSFDIRYLVKLNYINPYTRTEIADENKEKIQYLIKKLKNHNISTDIETHKPISKSQAIKQKAVTLFTEMDYLDNYTNVNWFLNLNTQQLVKWYREAEDIWNYRASLTNDAKFRIVQNKPVFVEKMHKLYQKSHIELQEIVLCEIEKLIMNGIERSDRSLGCMYVLSALCCVNFEVSLAMPWLNM